MEEITLFLHAVIAVKLLPEMEVLEQLFLMNKQKEQQDKIKREDYLNPIREMLEIGCGLT